jgi:hypothetical protein
MLATNPSELSLSFYPAHNHRRPIHDGHQRTRHEADGLQRLLLNVEMAIEPLEADLETTGRLE